jgi:hypothetical protein
LTAESEENKSPAESALEECAFSVLAAHKGLGRRRGAQKIHVNNEGGAKNSAMATAGVKMSNSPETAETPNFFSKM